jgi:inner membrane protein
MDNLCHTLVGLALAEAGLRRKTPLATATLAIGANLPDLDVLSYAWGPVTALAFRRGWTHGLPALAVWPFVLAGVMLAWDRLVRRRRHPGAPEARRGPLLLLAALAVATHPALDFFNVYGMRWLMPFDGRWLYGDTLFIVDPWLWLALGPGTLLSWRARRAGSAGPGRAAGAGLALAAGYVAVMGALALVARREVRGVLAARGQAASRVMAAPVPANPFRREVVWERGGAYGTATLTFFARPNGEAAAGPGRLGARVRLDGDAIHALADLPAARRAAASRQGRAFLRWARFPVYVQGPYEGCPAGHVCLRDLRYFRQSWAEVAIPVRPAVSLAPTRPFQERP